jgi:tetratricopeptide (TPR) repeat protein
MAEKTPHAVVALAAAIASFAAQRGTDEMRTLAEHGFAARVAQAAYGLCFYLWKTLVPFALSPAYLLEPALDPTAVRYVVSVLSVAAVTAALVAARRRAPWALASWALYVVIVAPVLGFAQTGPQIVADRYTYLAGLPWAVLAGAGLLRSARAASTRPGIARALAAATAAVLVTLGVLTHRQTRVWKDSMTLWTHVLRLDPANWVAYTNRGWVQPDAEAAIADYSAAIRVNPRYYLAYFNRGNVHHGRGDFAAAIDDFTAAATLLPRDPKAYNNRGWAREAIGDWEGAAEDYARALILAPPGWPHRALVEGNLARARTHLAGPAS